jgi:AAA+ superfamily predicted ATPase
MLRAITEEEMRYYMIQADTDTSLLEEYEKEKNSKLKHKRQFDDVIEHFVEDIRARDEGRLENEMAKTILVFSEITTQGMTIAVYVKDDGESEAGIRTEAEAYLVTHGFTSRVRDITEITGRRYREFVGKAEYNNFIRDDFTFLKKIGLQKGTSRPHGMSGSAFHCEEYITEMAPVEIGGALKEAGELLTAESLAHEIRNIFAIVRDKYTPGHPVHYAISSDDEEEANAYTTLLIRSLKACCRVASGRYTKFDYGELCEDFSKEKLEETFCMAEGGTVVVTVDKDTLRDSNFLTGHASRAEDLCKTVMRCKNNVLTIFIFPRVADKLKGLFFSAMDGVSMIEIEEHLLYDDSVRDFLRGSAKKLDIRPNKALYARVEQGRGYTKADLKKIFDNWYGTYLRTHIYTQYRTEAKLFSAADASAQGGAIIELEALIGLRETKALVKDILNIAAVQKRFAKDAPNRSRSLHMIFTGNPGSAKTTVARLVARVFKENGILPTGDLVEVGRADLVAQYVGWTAMKVKEAFKRAEGSVLFIDEAYALVDGSNSFGDEAINTIVQEMENRRDDTVVILAGYPDKMEGFLKKNPGLRSRISFHVDFPDYAPEELYAILEMMAEKSGLSFGEGVRERVMPILTKAAAVPEFGNGRYARNLLEKAQMRQASRIMRLDPEGITEEMAEMLLSEDFEEVRLHGEENRMRTIGFSA